MMIEPPFYPIVFVRGFAATMGEIEGTAATPYMGFNLGATKIRQKHDGEIVRFIFESPLLRLMKDEGYQDVYRGGSEIDVDEQVDPKSIWIFRYYEKASEELGTGERQTIPQIAEDLRAFILRIRKQVCGDDAEARKQFRVYLVAHSMGGLISRCYLQNICAEGTGKAQRDIDLELTDRPRNSDGHLDDSVHLVDKVFTYATPHNGIEMFGANVPDLGFLDPFHVRNFNRENIHEFLKLPDKYKRGDNVNSLNGVFPENRFFSLVGTNYDDYAAFFNLSRKATGPMSDGLVMIKNAVVHKTPRAFVHRSHGGDYGIVNSEEGYQNLRRFLFGDLRVDATLHAEKITLPKQVQEQKKKGKKIRASYHIDTTARVRGSIAALHERRFDQASALFVDYHRVISRKKPIYLFSGFLLKSARMSESGDRALAFAIRVAMRVPMYEVNRKFWFDSHFEGGMIIDETITLQVRLNPKAMTVRYGLASEHGLGEAPRQTDITDLANGLKQIEFPLGFKEGASNPPRPGFRGRLRLTVSPWN